MVRSGDRRRFLAGIGGGAAVFGLGPATDALAEPVPERLFRPGTVTYNIARDWDLETLIKRCEKAGLAAVELRTTHRHGVEPTLAPEERRKVRARFEDTPVKLLSLGSTCEFHSPDAEVVKQNIAAAGQFIRLAHDLGALGVKVRPNGLATDKGIPKEATLKQIGSALGACGAIAEPLGVEVWLEVHGKETSKPANIRAILDACGHPAVGITWNSNDTDVEAGSVQEAFDLLGRDIRCVHLRDLYVDYPFAELFALLRRGGYDRYTLAEIPESPDPDRVLAYFVALWDALSQPIAVAKT